MSMSFSSLHANFLCALRHVLNPRFAVLRKHRRLVSNPSHKLVLPFWFDHATLIASIGRRGGLRGSLT